jgi:DEAD/DEAH box helicase domain-containing protein
MDVNEFLQQLQRQSGYRDQIAHIRRLPQRPAKFGELSRPLPEPLQNILTREGIENLYCHQALAVERLRDGKNVLVVTGTASGKTLCYNLPVVERILAEPGARAMYLFPTKALAQDQLATLRRWTADEPELKKNLRVATYDGDTPSSSRGKIRSSANIILTNPDMLHQSILPYHAKWASFFRNLRYIVIDELHTYRGIFGSQFANVLRRLIRLLDFHGGHCQFICASATIGNPRELAEWLTHRQVELIDEDGSPRGEKSFVFWNPPFTDPGRIVRRSANIEAKTLFTELMKFGSQSIVFTRARVVAELIYRYARDSLVEMGETDLADRIRAYRGGYLAEDRREIEKLLFSGQLRGVCATNALELGIDVGTLDAAILVGYPGSISSAWQQAGRSGRRSGESLAVLVAYNDPIDQYIMHHPDYFFNREAERAVIDADNPHILAGHLACAAFELPLVAEDEKYFGPAYTRILEILSQENPDLHQIADHTHWASAEFPSRHVNLRTVSQDTFAIIDTTAGLHKTIGTLDRIAALEQLYPAAVYLHEGQTYIVTDLDVDQHLARVEQTTVDYYTRPIVSSGSRVLESQESVAHPFGELGFGPLEITWQTTGYKRIKFYTQEIIAIEPLTLPPQSLRTRGLWFMPSREIFDALNDAGYIPLSALTGLQNLLAWALPLLAMCDPGDIAAQINVSSFSLPAIVLYDRYLDGLGFARRGFENFSQLLRLADRIVRDCNCEDGCPSCVGVRQIRSSLPGLDQRQSGIETPDKQATLFLLERLLG